MNIQSINKVIVASATIASLAIMPSCALLDPDYAEYKKQKKGESSDPYGAPALGEANPYAIPGAEAETTAPYQPLPGVPGEPNFPPVVEDIPAPAEPYTPAPAEPVEPTVGATTHTVVSGDTIWGLTKKYGVTADAIRQANNLTSDVIKLGQNLTIPAK
jgi:LysM repeat protein